MAFINLVGKLIILIVFKLSLPPENENLGALLASLQEGEKLFDTFTKENASGCILEYYVLGLFDFLLPLSSFLLSLFYYIF
jgi:hypothetical protein